MPRNMTVPDLNPTRTTTTIEYILFHVNKYHHKHTTEDAGHHYEIKNVKILIILFIKLYRSQEYRASSNYSIAFIFARLSI